jgi:hypothetical protein
VAAAAILVIITSGRITATAVVAAAAAHYSSQISLAILTEAVVIKFWLSSRQRQQPLILQFQLSQIIIITTNICTETF